jgi:hypothetical protein
MRKVIGQMMAGDPPGPGTREKDDGFMANTARDRQ